MNRPLDLTEIARLNEKIADAQKTISTLTSFIVEANSEIANGVWAGSDEELAAGWKAAYDSAQWMKDRGLICATGKCNTLLGYECPSCKALHDKIEVLQDKIKKNKSVKTKKE